MTFRYTAWEVEASSLNPKGVVARPMVPLHVWGAESIVAVSALVDTGADHTLLPLSLAKEANVVLDEPSGNVTGFGGTQLSVIPGHVDLQLDDGSEVFQWTTIVGFVDFPTPADEIAIVGYGGFFEFFEVVFDSYMQSVSLSPTAFYTGIHTKRDDN